MTRKNRMWAIPWTDGGYRHFAASELMSSLYSTVTAPVAVTVEECHESEQTHWGWWDLDKEQFSIVYHSRHQVEMCFVDDLDDERGSLLPVKVARG